MAFAGGDEQDLIDAVRDAGALSISLVAEINSRIVGHVAFTPARAAETRQAGLHWGPWRLNPNCSAKVSAVSLSMKACANCANQMRRDASFSAIQITISALASCIPGTGCRRPPGGIFHDLATEGITTEGRCGFSSAVFGG